MKLKGYIGCKGVAEGEALVCRKPLMFAATDVKSGVITLSRHELKGKSIKNKILVLPNGCGSSTEEWALYQRQKAVGATPKAVIYTTNSPFVCSMVGNIIANIPLIYGFGENLFEIIKSGDRVKVDANEGIIEVIKSEE